MIDSFLGRFVKCAALLAAFTFSSGSAYADKGEVVVMAWGTSWEQGLNKVADNFEKKTGLKVVRVTQSGSGDGFARLKAMRNAPKIDVWFSTSTFAAQAGKDQQLFAKIPAAKLTNAANVIPGAITDGWVAAYYYPLSVIYRPDRVKQPIKEWSDLWNKDLARSVAIPVVQMYAARMLLTANSIAGGTIDDVTPGILKLKELKPNVAMYYASDSDVRRALAQGEISVLVGPPSQAKVLRDGGIKITVVSPKPSPLMFDVMTLVNTPQKEDAIKFIDHVLALESQEIISREFNMAPVNKAAKPAKELEGVLPPEADRVVFDDEKVGDRLGAWNERFQAEVAR